jgi:hypothetical protein
MRPLIVATLFLSGLVLAQDVPNRDYPLIAQLKSVQYLHGCCDFATVVVNGHNYVLEKHSWKGYELGEYHVRIEGQKMFFTGLHNGKPETWIAHIKSMSDPS